MDEGRYCISAGEHRMTTERQNIRNAYLDADTDLLLDVWQQAVAGENQNRAKYLRELLNEAMDEIEDTTFPRRLGRQCIDFTD
jgi:hypothetical protein